jgi:hypothetical protein
MGTTALGVTLAPAMLDGQGRDPIRPLLLHRHLRHLGPREPRHRNRHPLNQNSLLGQKHEASLFDLHFGARASQVLMHWGTVLGQGALARPRPEV